MTKEKKNLFLIRCENYRDAFYFESSVKSTEISYRRLNGMASEYAESSIENPLED